MSARRLRALSILFAYALTLLCLHPNLNAQGKVQSVGGYFSTKDNYQHALAATDDGTLYEVYFDPLRGIFRDELGCFGKVVAISGFFTADDGYQHAIVATDDGSIREVFFDPSIGIHISQPAPAVLPGVVSVAAFYA
jgi:hypothetical protein